jgi:hypothetical protein
MLNESRQAGAQIEITDRMVEVGVAALFEERPDLNISPSSLTDIFEKALHAALREGASRGRKQNTQQR